VQWERDELAGSVASEPVVSGLAAASRDTSAGAEGGPVRPAEAKEEAWDAATGSGSELVTVDLDARIVVAR
jgi:hypothetical protein